MGLNCRLILLFFSIVFELSSLLAQIKGDKNIINHSVDTVVALKEVIISAYETKSNLRHIPGSLSLLTGNAISSWDANSMATTISSLPGVNMQRGTYATSRIVIRGMVAEHHIIQIVSNFT